jgi:hypothetical protein
LIRNRVTEESIKFNRKEAILKDFARKTIEIARIELIFSRLNVNLAFSSYSEDLRVILRKFKLIWS